MIRSPSWRLTGEVDRFIFGFEESYGYLAGPYVRDKDADDRFYADLRDGSILPKYRKFFHEAATGRDL